MLKKMFKKVENFFNLACKLSQPPKLPKAIGTEFVQII
jgi:hypothetical protein